MFLYDILLIVHALVALALIGLVLVQQGKGADVGAAFGGGASQTLFGSRGSANFLSRTTAILATIFFVLSLSLTVIGAKRARQDGSVTSQAVTQQDMEKDVSAPDPASITTKSEPKPESEIPSPPK